MSANANANVSEANIKAITDTINIQSDDPNLQLQKETTSDYLNTIQFIKNSVLVNLFTHKYITPFCTIYSSHLMFLKYIKNKKIDINKLDGKYTSILFIFVLKLLEDVIVTNIFDKDTIQIKDKTQSRQGYCVERIYNILDDISQIKVDIPTNNDDIKSYLATINQKNIKYTYLDDDNKFNDELKKIGAHLNKITGSAAAPLPPLSLPLSPPPPASAASSAVSSAVPPPPPPPATSSAAPPPPPVAQPQPAATGAATVVAAASTPTGKPSKPTDYKKGNYSTINNHIEWFKKLIEYIIANPDINTYSTEIKNAKQSVYKAYRAYESDSTSKSAAASAVTDGAGATNYIENDSNHMKPINSIGNYDDTLFTTKQDELKQSFLNHYNNALKASVRDVSDKSKKIAAVQAYKDFKTAWNELIGNPKNKLDINTKGAIVSNFLNKGNGVDESLINERKIYMDEETINASDKIAEFPRSKLGYLQGGGRYSRKRTSKASTKKTRKNRNY